MWKGLWNNNYHPENTCAFLYVVSFDIFPWNLCKNLWKIVQTMISYRWYVCYEKSREESEKKRYGRCPNNIGP